MMTMILATLRLISCPWNIDDFFSIKFLMVMLTLSSLLLYPHTARYPLNEKDGLALNYACTNTSDFNELYYILKLYI